MEKQTNKEQKKIRASSVVSWILCILLFGIITFEIVMKFRGANTYIFNTRCDVVLSDSMSYKNKDEEIQEFLEGHDDQLQVGDLFFSTKVDENTELHVYDIVVFQNIETGRETVHRIVNIFEDTSGKTRYTIRADTANAESYDGAYTIDYIHSKVTIVIPWVGHIVRFFNSFFGMIFLIGLFFLIFLIDFVKDSKWLARSVSRSNKKMLVKDLISKDKKRE